MLSFLPAHATHVLQPLNVGIFNHVKRVWKKVLSEHYTKTFRRNVDKEAFPSILNEVHKSNEAFFTRVNALKGFEATGLLPLDKSRINSESFRISTLFHIIEISAPEATSDNITPRADTAITITPGNLITIQKELVKVRFQQN